MLNIYGDPAITLYREQFCSNHVKKKKFISFFAAFEKAAATLRLM